MTLYLSAKIVNVHRIVVYLAILIDILLLLFSTSLFTSEVGSASCVMFVSTFLKKSSFCVIIARDAACCS